MRDQCLRLLERRVGLLAERVSLSERIARPGARARADARAAGAERFPALAAELRERNPEEPYRRAFTLMRERVRATRRGDARAATPTPARAARRPARRRALPARGRAASSPPAATCTTCSARSRSSASTSRGSTSASTPRATARRSTRSSATLGVAEGYAALDEQERARRSCAREIDDRRPVVPDGPRGFSAATQEVDRARSACIRDGARRRATAAPSRPTSSRAPEGPADLLEVLLLMKEAGLARAGGDDAALRIVPLFEAGATLRGRAARRWTRSCASGPTAPRCARSATSRR